MSALTEIQALLGSIGIPEDQRAHDLIDDFLPLAVQSALPGALRLSWEERITLAKKSASIVAERSDVLIYGAVKKGAAEVLARLAEGLAVASLVPGGIRLRGVVYQGCLSCGRLTFRERAEGEKRQQFCECGYEWTKAPESEAP